jgi:hypothetical protein
MSFHIYRRRVNGADIHFEYRQFLRLGGAAGPIANQVKTLKGAALAEGWELETSTLLELAGVEEPSDDLAVLFDFSTDEPGAVCLYQLLRLGGFSSDRTTHLSLDFEVLINETVFLPVDQFKRSFTIPAKRPRKRHREILQLNGGPNGGDWKWVSPVMNLGAALVNPTSLVPT